MRRMALPSAMRARASSTETPHSAARRSSSSGMRSVQVSPGWTTVTLTPWGPSSSARFFVSAATATFLMLPMAVPDWRAASPLTLTMRPQPLAFRMGATARAQRR